MRIYLNWNSAPILWYTFFHIQIHLRDMAKYFFEFKMISSFCCAANVLSTKAFFTWIWLGSALSAGSSVFIWFIRFICRDEWMKWWKIRGKQTVCFHNLFIFICIMAENRISNVLQQYTSKCNSTDNHPVSQPATLVFIVWSLRAFRIE